MRSHTPSSRRSVQGSTVTTSRARVAAYGVGDGADAREQLDVAQRREDHRAGAGCSVSLDVLRLIHTLSTDS